MIEKNIVDRVPTKPGQIKLTPVSGAPDLFIMERADEPTVEGTPLDKTTLEGISKNRLTGRYYDLTATKVTLSSAGGAYNPLPISWTTTAEEASNGAYSITASANVTSLYKAFDGNNSTYWSNATKEMWVQLNVPEGITVSKMKIAAIQPDSWGTTLTIQGQTDNGAWATLSSSGLPGSTSLTEYTLNNPSTYRAYRLNIVVYTSAEIRLYEWQISNWSSATYRYDYSISSNIAPLTWEKGQRITVFVPNVSIVGVTQNNFNGIKANTILQPNRYYELVYNGSTFDAKEV